jgi:calcineurin-like phosphoesterase family protein
MNELLRLSGVPENLPRQSSQKHRLFLTADEHYYHSKIITYQDRPFDDRDHMNNVLVEKHNSAVRQGDHVIHIGDFCLSREPEDFVSIVRRLNGTHYFIDGSHDVVLFRLSDEQIENLGITILPKLFEFTFNGEKIVLCHYAMARWWASHHGSYHFYGHSHGHYDNPGRAIDVGVDCHEFLPVQIERAMTLVKSKVVEPNHLT